MGRGIVHNLLASGYPVVCHDKSPQAMDAVSSDGAHAADSLADLSSRAGLIITMLPSSGDVTSVFLGTSGILETASSGTVILDTSTIDPMTITHLAKQAEAVGVSVLDGGVSGSPRMNWNAMATFMVGGSHEVFASVESVIGELCKTLIYTGELGTAKVAKLVNNLMGAASMAALAEAFNLGMKAGVSSRVLHQAMMSSWARCANLEHIPPVADLRSDDDPDDQFSIDYMVKDLTSLMETAEEVDVSLAVSSLVFRMFSEASSMGHGTEPIWNVLEAVRTD